MKNDQVVAFLKQHVGLCQYFGDDLLARLVEQSRVVSYEPKEVVVEYGEDATSLGVLLYGELVASVPGDGGDPQFIGRFKPGDTFGEVVLMSGDPALTDIVAESPSQVLRIPVTVFQSTIVTEPRALRHISRTIADRFKQVSTDPAK